jgi:hypothetical protein
MKIPAKQIRCLLPYDAEEITVDADDNFIYAAIPVRSRPTNDATVDFLRGKLSPPAAVATDREFLKSCGIEAL